jgi:putative acetyltransferase
MEIRPARPEDRDAIVRIWRRAVEATHHFLTPADVDALEPQVRALPLAIELACDPGPVGWIAAHGDRIEALFVDPDVHGRGIGTALLGTTSATHVDVNEQNPSAQAFYAARGFVCVGRSEHDDEGRPFPLLHLQRRVDRSSDSPGPGTRSKRRDPA